MNSPEEKARQLVISFKPHAYYDSHDLTTRNQREKSLLDSAKECAEICVDEIIAALNRVVDDSMHVDDVPGSIGGANYYQKIKEEIQKL